MKLCCVALLYVLFFTEQSGCKLSIEVLYAALKTERWSDCDATDDSHEIL